MNKKTRTRGEAVDGTDSGWCAERFQELLASTAMVFSFQMILRSELMQDKWNKMKQGS